LELLEYAVDFEKRSAIKLQVLNDFIAEWTEPSLSIDGIIPEAPWHVYCDGVWGNAGAEDYTILVSPSRIKLCYTARLQFHSEADKCTNNITEYEAILLGLCKLRAIGVQTCTLRTSSKVVARKIEKECIARRAHPRKIFGPHQKKGELFQRLYYRVHRENQKR
jgi:ribonuclease HI